MPQTRPLAPSLPLFLPLFLSLFLPLPLSLSFSRSLSLSLRLSLSLSLSLVLKLALSRSPSAKIISLFPAPQIESSGAKRHRCSAARLGIVKKYGALGLRKSPVEPRRRRHSASALRSFYSNLRLLARISAKSQAQAVTQNCFGIYRIRRSLGA